MLVEDDFILRAHLAELLMLEGYGVSCAADGAEVLRRLKTEPTPSLILLDMVLPHLDGVTFRRLQLQNPALRDIPTVALTSLADIGDRELDSAAVIRKPASFDHLTKVLANLGPRP